MQPPLPFLALAETEGIVFDDGDLERFGNYLELLMAGNERMNLTAVRDVDAAWERHIFDSLTLIPLLVAAEAERIIDVGSGAGLPGIPLAIAMPSLSVTLLEATGKKAVFLEETVAALGLTNVNVVNDRAEVAGQDRDAHREQYDVVVARAVGPMTVLLELTLPFVRPGGHLFAVKGERAPAEVSAAKAALHILHASVTEQRRTPTGTIVIVEKSRKTPKIYPRRPGEPKRAPIGGTR